MTASRLRAYQDPTYDGPVPRRIPWLWALVTVTLVTVPIFTSDLQLRRFSQVVILVLAVLGINLCTGFGGMVSLGHGVFVGVGGFAMANLLDDAGLPVPIALLLAIACSGLFGVLLGLPAIRVRGIYLALVTFGFALVFGPIVRRMGSLTGGPTGRPVDFDTDPPTWTGLDPGRTQLYNYLLCLAVVFIWLALLHSLIHSRVGRALRAVRDDELAAVTFGIDVTFTKTVAFGISAAMAGTAGALEAFLFPFVSHSNYDIFLSLTLYAAAVVGGLGVVVGSVYGLMVLLLVPIVAGHLGFLGSPTVVFGLGLIVLTYVAPRGIAGLIDDLTERIGSRRRRP
jgi:branched-chain amino acid transport system permease protein